MKIIKLICSSAMALIFMSCGSNQKQGNFSLLPHPQAFEIIGTSKISGNDFDGVINFNNISLQEISLGEISLSKGKKLILAKGELPDITSEGYKLEIAVNSIKITGKDDAGLFYGLKTLGQLLEDARDQEVNLPQCKIKDYPALAYRAIHLDIKQHQYHYKQEYLRPTDFLDN